MKRRFTKLPIVSIAVVIGSLLLGWSLAPVGAQSLLTDGSVTVRSDGAVYLISNGMRRWVATVVITDEELNAYPEAAPIYSGLVPFGTTSAGTAAKPGTTAASKPGSSSATGSTASRTSSSSGSSSSGGSGQATVDPASGADAKDPNDPTLADAGNEVDPTGRAKPTGSTSCPDSHPVKGGYDKKYYDVDRPNYASVEVEACFRAGKDARDAGYTDAKKQ